MLDTLTPTERQIAAMIANGYSARDIGDKLGYHQRSINNYLTRIYRKLDVDGCKRAKLAAMYAAETTR